MNNGAPQYSYELGYYTRNKDWGIEFNFDHIKYYVLEIQRVRLTGTINNQHFNQDTLLTPDFVRVEQSDGDNYAMLKWVKWRPLLKNKKGVAIVHLLFEAGAGAVIPKTNSTIMGKHRDDRYKISGYVIGVETGIRYNIAGCLFAELGVKGAYANYNKFLTADGNGRQQWFGLHPALLLGVQLF